MRLVNSAEEGRGNPTDKSSLRRSLSDPHCWKGLFIRLILFEESECVLLSPSLYCPTDCLVYGRRSVHIHRAGRNHSGWLKQASNAVSPYCPRRASILSEKSIYSHTPALQTPVEMELSRTQSSLGCDLNRTCSYWHTWRDRLPSCNGTERQWGPLEVTGSWRVHTWEEINIVPLRVDSYHHHGLLEDAKLLSSVFFHCCFPVCSSFVCTACLSPEAKQISARCMWAYKI